MTTTLKTTSWIIEPHDPIILRDGRPFDATPGARARTLPFPYPATLAGAVRSRAGRDAGGTFCAAIDDVLQIGVRGPLLAQLADDSSDVVTQLVPAPADALLLGLEDQADAKSAAVKVKVLQLVPLGVPAELHTAMPNGLLPVGPTSPDPNKPSKRAPRFWYWSQFEQWLLKPEQFSQLTQLASSELGLAGLKQNSRMHVVMDVDSGQRKGREGGLFQTTGLEFTSADGHIPAQDSVHRLALLASVDADAELVRKLQPSGALLSVGTDTLGGEGRIVVWRSSGTGLPACPDALVTQIQRHMACRIILLTPAIFEQGYRPTWLLEPRHGVTVELKAVCNSGFEVVSGWDYAQRAPKPTRRVLRAGSVLYVCLHGEPDAIKAWVQAVWMQNISDAEQDRRDGFGLAAIGVWDGQAKDSDWGVKN